MRTRRTNALALGVVVLGLLLCMTDVALAGVTPVPAPLAGALGPAGLLVCGAAFGGYLLIRKLRDRC